MIRGGRLLGNPESTVSFYLHSNLTEVAAFVNLPVEISFKSRRNVVNINISQRSVQIHRVHLQNLQREKNSSVRH